MQIKNTIILFLVVIATLSTASAEEVILLANPEIAKEQFSDREIKKIFLGRYDTTKEGVSITPCYFVSQPVSDKLYDIVDKSADSYRRYWNKRLFSGASAPPKTFDNREQMYQYISRNKGAICLGLHSEGLPDNIAIVSK